jgi:hypothetical protein
MKNKLLTSALVGSLSMIGLISNSSAQTTITGNMAISYNSVSDTANTNTGNSYAGFGRETQINIANKGKLNVGNLSYAAGFSLEFDGADSNNQDQSQENMYIDIISGNTTLTFGSDHIQNTDGNFANLVGIGYVRPDGISNADGTYPTSNSPYDRLGVGIIQAIPGFGNLSAYYTPNYGAKVTGANDIGNGLKSTQVETGDNSATELLFVGDLGVKGLSVRLGQQFHKKNDLATAKDKDGKHMSAVYNMGQFTVAAEKKVVEGTGTGSTGTLSTAENEKVTGKSAGIAYALTKELSVGYTQAEAKTDANSIEEKVKLFAIGYNLGPVALAAQYMKVDNAANRDVNDGDIVRVRLSTAF